METPMNPNQRRVVRTDEEVVYETPVQPVVPVQPVYQQPVVAAQPVQPVYQQPVQPVVPVQPVPEVDTRRSVQEVGDMRMEQVRQGYYDPSGAYVERDEHITDDPYTRRLNILDRTSRIIYFAMGLLVVLLALRFLFRVINAGSANGFVNFIYNLTAPFVAPFNGIFNDQAVASSSVVEFSTLIAMGVYALVTYGIVQLLYVLLTPSRSSRETFVTTRRRRF